MARWKVRLAIALWLALACAVWNVIFDRVVVLAGRRYVHDAAVAMRAGSYLTIDSAMRPAIRRGLSVATLAAVPIAVVGLGLVYVAERRYRRSTSSKNATARGSFD